MKRWNLAASILAAVTVFLVTMSAAAQTAPPPPVELHHEGVVLLDTAPSGIGLEAGWSYGRRTQLGFWAGGYFPWFGQEFSVGAEAYGSVAREWAAPRNGLYTALYVGAGSRLPEPGQISLRSFAFVTTTHQLSMFVAVTAFWTPQSWYPGSLVRDEWFFALRVGPSFVAIPRILKFQAYVEATYVPGAPVPSPAPGFATLIFF